MVRLGSVESLISLVILLIAYLVTETITNNARAWAAYKMGDDTAERLGFLTWNPLAHIDVIGMVLLLLYGVGWGRNVPINPFNIRGRYERFRLTFAYFADVGAYLLLAIVALAILIALFGFNVLYLTMPMVSAQYIDLQAFTTVYHGSSSLSIVVALILVSIIYLSTLLGVIRFITNAFHLNMVIFFPDWYISKQTDLILILIPLVLMIVFVIPLKMYMVSLVESAGCWLARLVGAC